MDNITYRRRPVQLDFFESPPPHPVDGLIVRLIGWAKPCCRNLGALCVPGRKKHAGEILCSDCDRHLGWVGKEEIDFFAGSIEQFGPFRDYPILLRKGGKNGR